GRGSTRASRGTPAACTAVAPRPPPLRGLEAARAASLPEAPQASLAAIHLARPPAAGWLVQRVAPQLVPRPGHPRRPQTATHPARDREPRTTLRLQRSSWDAECPAGRRARLDA